MGLVPDVEEHLGELEVLVFVGHLGQRVREHVLVAAPVDVRVAVHDGVAGACSAASAGSARGTSTAPGAAASAPPAAKSDAG